MINWAMAFLNHTVCGCRFKTSEKYLPLKVVNIFLSNPSKNHGRNVHALENPEIFRSNSSVV